MTSMSKSRWSHGSSFSSVVGMATIAVLGTGRMGAAIACRLLGAGHRVTVWNRTVEKTEPLVAAGACAGSTPAEAAVGAEIVITMLTDASAVRDVVSRLAPRPGVTLVDMSTIGPAAVRALRLPAGVGLVDAPVLGSVAAAAAGKLTVLAGGDVDQVRPVLEVLGTVRRCGPLGSGAALKLVANTALIAGLSALADTLSVARALGVDAEVALSVVANGALSGAVARASAAGAAFPIGLAAKDLDLVLGVATPPVVRACAAVLRDAPDPAADLGTIVSGGHP